jgi:hypothetical protein
VSANYRDLETELMELLLRNTNDQEFMFEIKRILRGVDEISEECDSAKAIIDKYGDLLSDHYYKMKDPQKIEYVESFFEEAFDAERLIESGDNDFAFTLIEEAAKKLCKSKDVTASERIDAALQVAPELDNVDELWERHKDALIEYLCEEAKPEDLENHIEDLEKLVERVKAARHVEEV